MHLVIIAGFLGSGKTTLLLRLAEESARLGKKPAILVNEIGEIGIDNHLMRQRGFDVREILGGCICCSMAGDMAGALERVGLDFNPDLVLMEPTGAADPRNLDIALGAYRGPPFESLKTLTILDPLRLDVLLAVITPLIESSILRTDLVLISKADAALPEQLVFAREAVLKIRPEVKILMISAKNRIEPEVMGDLLPWPVTV